MLLALIFAIPWFYRAYYSIQAPIDYNAFGTYGDFFGGVIGTLFAIISVYFVYRAYQSQEKNKIESRFFELLKLHQDNLIRLKSKDPDIFHIYIDTIANLIKYIKSYPFTVTPCPEDVAKLGYILFFEGIAYEVKDKLHGITNENLKEEVPQLIKLLQNKGFIYKGAYPDFGIYFRQLFQTVTYVDDKKILNYDEKYSLIKILRVRLNIEEQYLLFLNSLVNSGLNWEKNKTEVNNQLITKYNLLKNIPREFKPIKDIDFQEVYPEILYEFESNDNERRKKRKVLEKNYS